MSWFVFSARPAGTLEARVFLFRTGRVATSVPPYRSYLHLVARSSFGSHSRPATPTYVDFSHFTGGCGRSPIVLRASDSRSARHTRLAIPVEAGSRVSIRDVDPCLAHEDAFAAAEAAVLRPIDQGVGDPMVDHPPLHLKAGDDFRLRVLEEGNDVRRRVAGGQKLQTVAGCGEGDVDAVWPCALARISSAVTGLSSSGADADRARRPRTTSIGGGEELQPARPCPLVYNPAERICRLYYLTRLVSRPFLRYNVTAPGFVGVSGIFRSVTRLVCNGFKKLDFSSFFWARNAVTRKISKNEGVWVI